MAAFTEEAIKALGEGESFLQTVLQDPKYKRYRNLYLAYKVGKPLWMALRTTKITVHKETRYSYRLENGSYLYTLMANWMRENLPPKQLSYYEVGVQNAQIIKNDDLEDVIIADNDMDDDDVFGDDESVMTERRSVLIPEFTFAADRPKFFKYKGVSIELEPDGEPEDDEDDDSPRGRRPKVAYYTDFVLSADGDVGRFAIEELLTEILMADQVAKAENKGKHRGNVFTLRRGGGDWTNRSLVPPRNFKNVFLAKQMRDELVDDIRKFMALRTSYERLGLPYHRGYLLYGPPGTGKTSIVQAIANEFSMNLYCLNLADVRNDTDLLELFHNVRRNKSIIFMEDIDAVNVTNERKSVNGEMVGVTLSGLLNALDGVTSAHGAIVFMTTNDKKVPHPEDPERMVFERLDEALVRPGRVDYELEISYIVEEQYNGFFELFFRQAPITPFSELDFHKVAPVEVMECFKRYPLDIAQADAFLRSQFAPGIPKSQREKIHALSGVSAMTGDVRKNGVKANKPMTASGGKKRKKAKRGKKAPKG